MFLQLYKLIRILDKVIITETFFLYKKYKIYLLSIERKILLNIGSFL